MKWYAHTVSSGPWNECNSTADVAKCAKEIKCSQGKTDREREKERNGEEGEKKRVGK